MLLLPGLSPVAGKDVVVKFDGGRLSSDGGILTLREIEGRLRVAERMAACIEDPRASKHVTHSMADIIRFRLLMIAAGYEDGNDADFAALRSDVQDGARSDAVGSRAVLSADDLPVGEPARRPCPAAHGARHGRSLLRSPIPRLPSGSCWISTTRSTRFTAASNCACSTRTTTNTAFNPSSCSMARAVSSLLCCARPNAPAARRSRPFLRRLLRAIRANWPRVEILSRGDSHYCAPEVLDFCRANRLDYILGVAPTSTLRRHIEGLEAATKTQYETTPGNGKARQFKEFYDGAASWSRVERVIARVEVGAQGPDTRFVVTNLQQRNARRLYEDVYCRRGQAENHIKSWKTHLAADRTSCTKASANQLRLFLHAGAYWIMWGLRVSMPKHSMWRVAQFDTLRLRLIKIAARVVEMKTMIRVHLPTSCPAQHIFHYALGQIRVSKSRASSPDGRGVTPPISQPFPINPQTSASPNTGQPLAMQKRVRQTIIHSSIAFNSYFFETQGSRLNYVG